MTGAKTSTAPRPHCRICSSMQTTAAYNSPTSSVAGFGMTSTSVSFPIGAVMLLQAGSKHIRFKPRPLEGTDGDVREYDLKNAR